MIGSVRGDNPVAVVKIENTSDVIFITAQGRMFKFPVHKIPITERSSAGIDIRILVKGISSEVVEMFDEKFARMWELYLCACAATFMNGIIDLHQIVFTNDVNNELPMTRWY